MLYITDNSEQVYLMGQEARVLIGLMYYSALQVFPIGIAHVTKAAVNIRISLVAQ